MDPMNWKYHTVYSEVGFTEKFRIRTDGTRWQVRKEDGFETYISLARHVAAMQLVLQRHPEAEMEMVDKQYEDGMDPVIYWYEDIDPTHEAVVRHIAQEKKALELKKKREDDEIERMKRERPELFK